jgi:hypothetical protein
VENCGPGRRGGGSARPGRGALPVTGLLAMLLCLCAAGAGCATPGSGGGPRKAADDPEAVLWGGGRCREAADCASGLCTAGMCQGYLAASTEEARDAVAPALRSAGAGPDLPALSRALEGVLGDPDSDDFVRSRAADAFRHLPPAEALRVLPGRLSDPAEPVRFFAARALAAAGDPDGRAALEPFRNHSSEAVRILAATALAPAPASP